MRSELAPKAKEKDRVFPRATHDAFVRESNTIGFPG